MAATILTFALCTVDGNDVVSELTGITTTLDNNIIDISHLGTGSNRSRIVGLGDFRITLTAGRWDADESAAAGLGKALYDGSTFNGGTGVYVIVVSRLAVPTAAARRYTMNAVANGWDPLGATVGEVVGGGNSIEFSLQDSTITVATS